MLKVDIHRTYYNKAYNLNYRSLIAQLQQNDHSLFAQILDHAKSQILTKVLIFISTTVRSPEHAAIFDKEKIDYYLLFSRLTSGRTKIIEAGYM